MIVPTKNGHCTIDPANDYYFDFIFYSGTVCNVPRGTGRLAAGNVHRIDRGIFGERQG